MTKEEQLIDEWMNSFGLKSSQIKKLNYITISCRYEEDDEIPDRSTGLPTVDCSAIPTMYLVNNDTSHPFKSIDELVIWLNLNYVDKKDRIVLNMNESESSKIIDAWKEVYS